MEKTKIDWCDSTWNPITGCLHGCEYCYARSIAHRFSGGGENWTDDKIIVLDEKVYGEEEEKSMPYPYGFIPTFHRYRLNDYIGKQGRNIFVCSMADLFGSWVPDAWIDAVFEACERATQHNYLFLSKNPDRYVSLDMSGRLLHGENLLYGLTVSDKKQAEGAMIAADMTEKAGAFLSIEPILEDVLIDDLKTVIANFIDWVIIGAETGRRKDKVIPKREWIEDIVNACRKANIPVFMKSSLADIWGEPLIQEFPKELRRNSNVSEKPEVEDVKECPKSEIEKVQWLKWENLKEWGEIECPMLGNERVMTYHLEGVPTYYSYTAPFIDEDGDVCYYKYDHDEDCWEDSIMCMGEYEEGTHYRIC